MHGSVKSFTLGIALRVIRSGMRLLNVVQLTEFGDHCILKTSTLIGVDSQRDTILEKPFLKE